MGKNKSSDLSTEKYRLRDSKEISFVNKIYEMCSKGYTDVTVDNQIVAIKRVIEYIKYRKQEGATIEKVKEEVRRYIYDLMYQVSYPTLSNFYRARTYDYLDGMDLKPYIKEIIDKKIDIRKFAIDYHDELDANIEKNIIIELCQLMSDFEHVLLYSSNEDIINLYEKIKDNKLSYSDIDILAKYINLYIKEKKIGRNNCWQKAVKNPEELRKKFVKYIDDIFEVQEIGKAKCVDEIRDKEHKELNSDGKLDKINSITGDANQYDILQHVNIDNKKLKRVKLKALKGNPFIGTDEKNNSLIFLHILVQSMTECARPEKVDDMLRKMYDIVVKSSTEKTAIGKEFFRKQIYEWFSFVEFNKNTLQVNDALSKRIAILIDFFSSNGQLEKFCETNASRLKKIKLPELKISHEDLYRKFLATEKDKNDLLYLKDAEIGKAFYEECFKNTPLEAASQEALIAMSSFYVNRLAKEEIAYERVRYIFDQQDVIEQIYENPEIEYEDLDIDRNALILYMSMYDVVKSLILQLYISKLQDGASFREDEWIQDSMCILSDIKNAYEKFFKEHNSNFNYSRDIKNVIYGAVLSECVYDCKQFSVNSLIYTAVTDKKKNIINWGYVPEDENKDKNMILIGFDIKSLNMPMYTHVRRDELISFLKKLTGNTLIPVYEGADDMYNYALKKRLTTQILYPLSKDEKKTLLKIKGIVTEDRTYQHLRWLQQPNNPPTSKYVPGNRVYNIETGEIIKKSKKSEKDDCNTKIENINKVKKSSGHANQDAPSDSDR